jgi:biotin carboxylase
MPRLLLIAPDASYHTAPFQAAGQRLGVEIIVASEGRFPIVPRQSTGLRVDFLDLSRSLRLIEAFYRQTPFDGVIGVDDGTVELAAVVARALSLPTNPPKAVRLNRRKDKSRILQKESGLQTPWFVSVELDSRGRPTVPAGIAYPCVAKPVSLSASRGVIRANNHQELLAALARISAIIESSGREHPRICLIEEYIPGSEYVVEGLLDEGDWRTIAVFSKPDLLEGPFFEETIYITPTGLDVKAEEEITDTVRAACGAYGLKHGPIHAECRVNEQGTWLIELASRTIGGKCARIFELGTGQGLEDISILNAMGCAVPIEDLPDSVGVMMIPVPGKGILRRIEGVETARRITYIEDIEIDVKSGQELVPWPEGSSYPGFIFARGPNNNLVINSLRSAHDELNFVMAPQLPLVIGD